MITYLVSCYIGIHIVRKITFFSLTDAEIWISQQRAKKDNKYTKFNLKYIFN